MTVPTAVLAQAVVLPSLLDHTIIGFVTSLVEKLIEVNQNYKSCVHLGFD